MTKKTNIAAENKLRLSTIAPAAFKEGTAMSQLAKVLQAAFKGRSTGTWDGDKNKAVPSPFFSLVYEEYKAGSLAVMLPQFGNMGEADAIAAARKVIADPKRGEAANAALASIRQRFKRGLDRAGIATPRPKESASTAKATKAREATKAGQGATKPDKSESAIVAEAKKLAPPSEYNRETDVAWLRETIARMIMRVEKYNQHAHKVKGAAMPSNIIGDICDLQDRAKKWVF